MKDFEVSITDVKSEVTGTCFSICIERPKRTTERILLDCGKYKELNYNYLNNYLQVDATSIDSVIITHSHLDHIGKLPYLTRAGYRGNIYCSKISKESIPIALKDCYKVDLKNSISSNKPMFYSLNDVATATSLLKGIEYNVPFKISKYTTVTFFMNCHMLGAVSVLLQIECPKHQPQNYLFFGDYSTKNILFKAVQIPNKIKRLPLNLVLEATYGNDSTTNKTECFLSLLNSELKKGQNILLPTIVQERLEVILYHLNEAQKLDILSKNIKIFVHSKLGKEFFNIIYCKYTNIKDFLPKNLVFVPDKDFDKVLKYNGKKIIIAGSGMADDGAIRFYLQQYLEDPTFSIIFTCYTPPCSTGSILKNAKPGQKISINGVSHSLKSTVLYTSEFSQHIRGDEWKYVLNDFTNILSISVNHGNTNSMQTLVNKLSDIFPNIPITIINSNNAIMVNDFGLYQFKPVIFNFPLNKNYTFDFIQKKNKKAKVHSTKKRKNLQTKN